MKKIIKNALILTIITVVSGCLLGLVYEITKEPIAKAQEKAKQQAYKTVLAEETVGGSFSFLPSVVLTKVIMRKVKLVVHECYAGKRKSEEVNAAVLKHRK